MKKYGTQDVRIQVPETKADVARLFMTSHILKGPDGTPIPKKDQFDFMENCDAPLRRIYAETCISSGIKTLVIMEDIDE
jgi:hypothetical protein